MANCLIVVSKAKATVKPTRVSEEAINGLSEFVTAVMVEAGKVAEAVGRKTIDLKCVRAALKNTGQRIP